MKNSKFPSGLSIRRAKDRAKDLLKEGEVKSLNEAQNRISMTEMGVPWAKAMKIISNHIKAASCAEWVLIPLSHDLSMRLHLWTRFHYMHQPENDKALEQDIEHQLSQVFSKNGFTYNFEEYGDYRLKLGHSNNGTNGVLMPKVYFTGYPEKTLIQKNPNLP